MPFLVLNGTTIPIVADPVEGDVLTVGDRERAWDGTMLTRTRARKTAWQCATPWLSDGTAPGIYAVLTAAAPHTLTGDVVTLLGLPSNVVVEVTASQLGTFAGGQRRKSFEFVLHEV